MTSQAYRERILAVESYCQRLAFLCPRDCPAGDFWAHAEFVMRYLTECVEADYYETERPAIASLAPHLDDDARRHLAIFDARWTSEASRI